MHYERASCKYIQLHPNTSTSFWTLLNTTTHLKHTEILQHTLMHTLDDFRFGDLNDAMTRCRAANHPLPCSLSSHKITCLKSIFIWSQIARMSLLCVELSPHVPLVSSIRGNIASGQSDGEGSVLRHALRKLSVSAFTCTTTTWSTLSLSFDFSGPPAWLSRSF